MKVCVLGSGSKGNAIYVESGETRLLFDAGFSWKELKRRLIYCGLDPDRVGAVVVSHEHTDHIAGLRALGKKLPVFATSGTIAAVRRLYAVEAAEIIVAGEWAEIGRLRFLPLPVTHDAAEPVCFLVEDGDARMALVTDLGVTTRALVSRLTDLTAAVVEANHDLEMLMNGPYPWELKQRIRGRHGHLSNEDSAALVGAIVHPGLRRLFLAHLSETNNTPELARRTVAGRCGLTGLQVCSQNLPGELITL